jgi:aspartate/methionine/tyrosine aminotransferase
MRFAPRVETLIHSPIGAAHALVPQRTNDRPLLDLSQAAPSFPPAPVVADRIAEVAREPDGGRYAPQPGLPPLRAAFADELSLFYEADITADNVLITAGCNQAFCIMASALTSPGDEAIVVAPFYFNHDMWLRVEGVHVRHLEPGPDLQPDPDEARALISDSTRMIVLVSPGNPSGVTVSPETIEAFAELAKEHGLILVLDETYRRFRDTDDIPHRVFDDPDWGEHVVSLHSFSKDYAIPGYRVGALVGGTEMITQALKVLDCIAISAPRIGQEAALAGLLHAGAWCDEQVERIRHLERRFLAAMADRPGGFDVVTSGAYFGWVRHAMADVDTGEVVRRLVLEHDVLVIPGTAFTPADQQMLRLSFANLTPDQIDELPDRLREVG